MIEILDVLSVDKEIIKEALYSGFVDFEDGIQAFAAAINDIDIIATRNTKDFDKSEIKAMLPEEIITSFV